jgi:Family of unknown function (DUF6174)
VRFRGVLYGAILLMAAAGCAGQTGDAETSAGAPAAAPPAWTEPADYKFAFESSCGEQALIGRFRVTVAGGAVTDTEGLDEAGRRALMLRIADLIPTLGQMVTKAEQARAEGAEVTIDRDPADGHPTAIRIDPEKNAIDDETCFAISGYTIGGQPGPSASPTR